MRQHHTKVHGDPLPNRTCSGCETDFYDPNARRDYCDDCNPNAGEHNGNWTDATETSVCKCCGSTVTFYPSSKKGIYCSECIEAADGLLPDNPSTKGNRVTVSCRSCDGDLEIRPARLEEQERGVFARSTVMASGSLTISWVRLIISGRAGASKTVERGGVFDGRHSIGTRHVSALRRGEVGTRSESGRASFATRSFVRPARGRTSNGERNYTLPELSPTCRRGRDSRFPRRRKVTLL